MARTILEVPEATTAKIRLAWDDQLVLRVNDGKPMLLGNHYAFRPQTVEVPLDKGQNEVVIKLSNTTGSNHGGWVFAFRATAKDGTLLKPRLP